MGLTTLTFAGQAQWETYMEQAKDAYNHRDFDEAVIKLNAARDEAKTFGEQDRRYIMTLSEIGYVYEGQKNYVKSEAAKPRPKVVPGRSHVMKRTRAPGGSRLVRISVRVSGCTRRTPFHSPTLTSIRTKLR